jgi:hypothetical protein
MEWVPFHVRHDPAGAKAYEALRDGIPGSLRTSVAAWVKKAINILSGGDKEAYRGIHLLLERTLDIESLDWRYDGTDLHSSLVAEMFGNEDLGLSVLDLLLRELRTRVDKNGDDGTSRVLAKSLDVILRQGRSAFRVREDRSGLEDRIDPTATERADGLLQQSTRASDHLRRAWDGVYGLKKNPSHAYHEAVKAVEAAAIPVAVPRKASATLGDVLGDMKAHGEKRYLVALDPSGNQKPVVPIESVIGMIELLWKSQYDRHGTPDESTPASVREEEAEAALHLALTLTHWFESGVVRRK